MELETEGSRARQSICGCWLTLTVFQPQFQLMDLRVKNDTFLYGFFAKCLFR
jgi:hypothetical protein